MIQHIVFDFGGVLLDLDGVHTGYPDVLAVIFDVPIATAKDIWSKNKTSVIAGKETPEEFLNRTKEELKLSFDVGQGLEYWKQQNIITKERIDWELVTKLEELKAKYQIHMLTDQIQLTNGAEEWIDDINRHFHTIVRSFEHGVRKPFPEAYQNLLRVIAATANPETVLFIDDNAENIQAAEAAGIHGLLYRFKDHASLRAKFEELGIE